jgi:hypothetical protein
MQIHMFKGRVKQLRNQVDSYSRHNEALNRRLDTFWRKEVDEKEVAEKEAAMEDDNEEEDQQVLPPGSSDDDDLISPIRFPRVMHWLKCPICLSYLYEQRNGLLFHIECFIKDEMSPPTWSNNISIFLGCLNNVWWMNN